MGQCRTAITCSHSVAFCRITTVSGTGGRVVTNVAVSASESSIRFRLFFFTQVYKRRRLFLIRVTLMRRLPQIIHSASDIDDSCCNLQAIWAVRMCRRNRPKPYRKALVEFEAARKHFYAISRPKFMHTRIRRVSEVMLREYTSINE